jgi:hypothetical protein
MRFKYTESRVRDRTRNARLCGEHTVLRHFGDSIEYHRERTPDLIWTQLVLACAVFGSWGILRDETRGIKEGGGCETLTFLPLHIDYRSSTVCRSKLRNQFYTIETALDLCLLTINHREGSGEFSGARNVGVCRGTVGCFSPRRVWWPLISRF